MLIFERWAQPDLELRSCLYFMIMVFTTVGLGDIVCYTWLGRSITIVCSCAGIVFLAICVGFLVQSVKITDDEMKIQTKSDTIVTLIETRIIAAKMIQRAFRKYLKRKNHDVSPSNKESSMKGKSDFALSSKFCENRNELLRILDNLQGGDIDETVSKIQRKVRKLQPEFDKISKWLNEFVLPPQKERPKSIHNRRRSTQ